MARDSAKTFETIRVAGSAPDAAIAISHAQPPNPRTFPALPAILSGEGLVPRSNAVSPCDHLTAAATADDNRLQP